MTTVEEMLVDLGAALGSGGVRINAEGGAALAAWCHGDCRDGVPREEFRRTPSGGRLWRLLLATIRNVHLSNYVNGAGELDAEGVSMLEDIMFSGTRYCTDPATS